MVFSSEKTTAPGASLRNVDTLEVNLEKFPKGTPKIVAFESGGYSRSETRRHASGCSRRDTKALQALQACPYRGLQRQGLAEISHGLFLATERLVNVGPRVIGV